MSDRKEIDRDWSDYPMGTKAYAHGGGYWERVYHGWMWCTGSTFPAPGADAYCVELPADALQSEPKMATLLLASGTTAQT